MVKRLYKMVLLFSLGMFLFSCAAKQAKAPSEPKVIDKMTLQVFFDSGKAILTETDLKELPKAVDFLKKYPGTKVRLDGYTDSTGPEAFNMKLSERRATAVRDYLVKEADDGGWTWWGRPCGGQQDS